MKLIVMAHRGEAQVFLKELSFRSLEESFTGLYKANNMLLLITGEGVYEALTKTSWALGAYPSINEVWNIGVAGSLSSEIEIGSTHFIRTVYQSSSSGIKDEMDFKSFTSNHPKSSIDIVTSHKRIITKSDQDFLDHFAPLVDREAWGVAFAASRLKCSFNAIKLVSDHISDAQGICEMVKEQSIQWSDQLFREFIQLTEEESLLGDGPLQIPGIYLTVAQERKFERLVDALLKRGLKFEQIIEKGKLSEIKESKQRPKEQTKKFLNNLQELLNPVLSEVKKDLEEVIRPLKQSGFQVKFDQALEKETLHLSGPLNSQDDIEQIRESLKKFSFKDFVHILKAKQDV